MRPRYKEDQGERSAVCLPALASWWWMCLFYYCCGCAYYLLTSKPNSFSFKQTLKTSISQTSSRTQHQIQTADISILMDGITTRLSASPASDSLVSTSHKSHFRYMFILLFQFLKELPTNSPPKHVSQHVSLDLVYSHVVRMIFFTLPHLVSEHSHH